MKYYHFSLGESTVDEPIISLECYEPAGVSLDFTQEDLLGHTLAIGGSGSGKTSRLILPIVSQLIHAGDAGLCILDTKADGIAEHAIRLACFDAEREDDLVVINGDGSNSLDIFGELDRGHFEAVDQLSGLLGASIPRDERNQYWENTFQTLLRQILRIIFLTENLKWNYTTLMQQLIRYLLLHQLRDPVYVDDIDELKARRKEFDPSIQLIIDEVVATHRMWDTLDFRTRSILQSMAASLTASMNNQTAFGYFDGTTPVEISSILNQRKIHLISIDGVRHPECARLVSRMVKGLFYDAVLKNDAQQTNEIKAGLILDDWPICATAGSGNRYSDTDALAMIRSRGGFILASTQSLAALDIAIGKPSREAALANFSNLVFFRGRDPEVDAIATAYLGRKTEILTDTTTYEGNSPTVRRNLPAEFHRQIRTPAVPQGAIARLATGDAYALIGSTIYNEALSLVPQKQKQNIKP
ncbi:MAG: type IV secretory system conjugative DNA transfer family protein [Opitutaceae bacterium]